MPKSRRRGYYVDGEWVAAGSETDQQLRNALHDPDAPSRSAKKRASEALQQLGERLVAAPAATLARLTLPEELRDAVAEARNIRSFGARRRQLQQIGKLMRRQDDETVEAIRAALSVGRNK